MNSTVLNKNYLKYEEDLLKEASKKMRPVLKYHLDRSFFPALDALEYQIEAHSYTYVPGILNRVKEIRITLDGTETELTSAFYQGLRWHIEQRDWDGAKFIFKEYKRLLALPTNHIGNDFCYNCSFIFTRKTTWTCPECKEYRTIDQSTKQDQGISVDEAKDIVANYSWSESLDRIVDYANSGDAMNTVFAVERSIELMRLQKERSHFSYKNLRRAVTWLADNNKLTHVARAVRQFKMLWAENWDEQVCGASLNVCQEYTCDFRYDGNLAEMWACPKCDTLRSLCMHTFRNESGRCPAHAGGRERSYYKFKQQDLAATYGRFLDDPEIVSAVRSMALIDARISQLTGSLDGLDPTLLYKKLKGQLHYLEELEERAKALGEMEDAEIHHWRDLAIEIAGIHQDMAENIERSVSDKEAWREIRDLMIVRKGQHEVQVKQEIGKQYTMSISTVTQMLTTFAQLVVARLSSIPDVELQNQIRLQIMRDGTDLMTGNVVEGQFVMREVE